MTRRTLIRAALAAACLAAAHAAPAQSFPSRTVTIVVPFAPGGPTDQLSRALAARMQESLGKPVIVENRPGTGGQIAAGALRQAEADGHTLFVGATEMFAINPTLYTKFAYDPAKDFAPVAAIAEMPMVLVVPKGSPAGSVQELIALARSRPGGLSYASQGPGSIGHMLGELVRARTGAPLNHVPYKGSAPALQDLVGGQVDMMFTGVSAALPFVRGGKLRALGVSGTRRLAALPEYAPVADTVPGFEATTIYALMGPSALPKDIVQRLSTELGRLVAEPGPRERLLALGAEPGGGPPEQLAAYIAREIPKWAKIVKAAKIRGE